MSEPISESILTLFINLKVLNLELMSLQQNLRLVRVYMEMSQNIVKVKWLQNLKYQDFRILCLYRSALNLLNLYAVQKIS